MKKISIAIPTWESHGKGSEFIDDLLRTIEIQTFKDFEVCISDHSENDDVFSVVNNFADKFEIVYYKNKFNRGNGPDNTNKAIELCSGEIIKIMFQDDFFYDDESLEKIFSSLNDSDKMWLLNASIHTNDDGNTFYNELYPKWNDDIINGVNTISSPSVLTAKKEVFEHVKFDPKLVMMMDCEFYYYAKKIYGDPIYYNDVLVASRIHQHQISSIYLKNNYEKNMNNELTYCKEKHNIIN